MSITFKTASLAAVMAAAALAAGCDTMSSMTDRMRGSRSDTADSQSSQHATQYWKQNAQGGYMSRDSAMTYESPDGRRLDFSRADTDQDRRISESEWRVYHGNAGR